MGESVEAVRRTLSACEPDNPEKEETALLLIMWLLLALEPAEEQKYETEESPPGPPSGEGAALFLPSPGKEHVRAVSSPS